MKKTLTLILSIFLLTTLTACGHEHVWKDATCNEPAICEECGEVQENSVALGHDFQEATCSKPKTCSRCQLTEGSKLKHQFVDATCEKPKTCELCNHTEGEALGHKLSQWKTTKAATCSEKGIQEATCEI